MKQVIIVVGIAVLIILVSLTILSIESKSDRQDELDRVVSAAVKQTVKDSQVEKQMNVTSDKEMVAQFIQNMCTSIKSDGDLQIEIMGVDYKEGMLDVMVTEQFLYPNGKQGKITTRKCAIYQ
ncbi:MAG: hypothetical protein HFG28_04100 [Eubacterium sp.]|nr:hypothetical protein [Eubacterium sp.]